MARIPVTIMAADPATGNAIAGATATVRNRGSGATVTLYAAETGPTTVGNPLTTDASGRAQAWADRAPLRIDYAGSGLTAWTEYRDIAPATDRATDELMLAYGAGVPIVTTLPASPVDGQTVDLVVDDAGTYGGPFLWRLRYRAGSAGTSKWHPIGTPPPLRAVYAGGTTTTGAGNTWAALANAVSIAAPVAGIYDGWAMVGSLGPTIGSVVQDCALTPKAASETIPNGVGGQQVAGVPYCAWRSTNDDGTHDSVQGRRRAIPVAAAGELVALWAKTSATQAWSVNLPVLELTPVRLG